MKQDKIYLVGFMGTGKTTVGKLLAKRLGCDLVDVDEEIVSKQQMPISKIFEEFGEECFRNIETQTLVEVSKKSRTVVSCGGGIVLKPENIEILRQTGVCVLLTAQPQTILERVSNDTSRPLLSNVSGVEQIENMLEKREAYYRNAAEITVQTDGKQAEEIVSEILDLS